MDTTLKRIEYWENKLIELEARKNKSEMEHFYNTKLCRINNVILQNLNARYMKECTFQRR